MQLRLEIHHVTGCFSLVDADGVVSKGHVIKNAFYAHDNQEAKADAQKEMLAFARGVVDGWHLASNALGVAYCASDIVEYVTQGQRP